MKQSTCTCTCTHTSIIACKVIHPMNIHPLSCMLPLWMQWLEEDLLGLFVRFLSRMRIDLDATLN